MKLPPLPPLDMEGLSAPNMVKAYGVACFRAGMEAAALIAIDHMEHTDCMDGGLIEGFKVSAREIRKAARGKVES